MGGIFFGERLPPLDCLVWNVCDHGALLEINPDVALPGTFRLIASSLHVDKACSVIWRNGRKVGVAFAA
ncbi:pilus assembly protein PilZ [Methylobacterium sp. OAE515]|uniref:pilus assembly protein PilZ n=1 Tax=Methylobacterium sp. OAE515 TaxID=2817895 RepID=UPI0019F636C1